MSSMIIDIPTISNTALDIMKRVIDENEKTQVITDEQGGPIPLASALSDFFQLASGLEQENQRLESDTATELAHYALDLVDRLSYHLRHLDIHDQRDNLARVFVSLSVWFARQGAQLENMAATADSFASLVNGENQAAGLTELTGLMEEVLDAGTDEMKLDEDRSDPWRPWRVINLNSGIAATRSLDPELMIEVFDRLEHRVPHDLPGFFSDGRRQMDVQEVPQDVRDVMTKYSEKWPVRAH